MQLQTVWEVLLNVFRKGLERSLKKMKGTSLGKKKVRSPHSNDRMSEIGR
jgi:hypothetical protein